jgi:hypothetical protein
MRGAKPSLPQYAFMAWCSVKRSTGTTLTLSLLLPFYKLSIRDIYILCVFLFISGITIRVY